MKNTVVPAGIFPIGVHVYREPFPDLEGLLNDLLLVKEAGFTMVKIQEHWATDEPIEGALQIERVESIVAAARDVGLGVYFGFTFEQMPAWVWRKFPDAYMVDSLGQQHNDPTMYTLPVDGKPGPNWYHEGVREACTSFINRIVGRLSAYENIWVWNVWQEVGFWFNDAGALGFDYSGLTLTKFRTWLEERYGDVISLNSAWQVNLAEWVDVEPPRRYTSSPAFLDWRAFMDDVYITDAIAFKTSAVRAADPLGRPVFSHVGSVEIGSTVTTRWSRPGDLFGTSVYPAWRPLVSWEDSFHQPSDEFVTKRAELWGRQLLEFDAIRCAVNDDKPVWAAEFQGGPINQHLHIGRTPTADDIQRWVLSTLAAGANGVSFWNLRSEFFWHELNGFGLLSRTEQTSERFAEVSRLATAVSAFGSLFAQGVVPRPDVGILVDQRQFNFALGSDEQSRTYLAGSIRGHYHRLAELGIACDFVDTTEIGLGSGSDRLNNYKVLIAPAPFMMAQATGDALIEYTRVGGTVIADAAPGHIDGNGFATIDGMFAGATELFGARHLALSVVDEPEGDRRWTPEPRGWGEFCEAEELRGEGLLSGTSLLSSGLLQTLVPTTGTAVLRNGDGEATAVSSSYGDGRATLIGTLGGLSSTSHRSERSDEVYLRLLEDAGVAAGELKGILIRRRVLENREAFFVINLNSSAATVALPIDHRDSPVDLLSLPIDLSRPGQVSLSVAPLAVRCVVATRKP